VAVTHSVGHGVSQTERKGAALVSWASPIAGMEGGFAGEKELGFCARWPEG
jgi:hypothetical protein